MPTVTRYPSTHTPVSGVGFATSPANAYSDADANAVASTGTIAKNTTISGDFGGFNVSDIPAGATINSVAVQVRWRHTGSSTGSTLGAFLVGQAGTIGSELTRALVTTLTADAATITGVTRADLDALAVRVRGSRAASNTATAAELEYVRVVIDYTDPPPAEDRTGSGTSFAGVATLGGGSGSRQAGPAVVGVASNVTGVDGQSSVPVVTPANVPGDVVLVFGGADDIAGNSNTLSVTDTDGNTYEQLHGSEDNNRLFWAWWRRSNGTSTPTVTVQSTEANRYISAGVAIVRGCPPGNPFNAVGSASDGLSTTTKTAPSVTTTPNDCLLLRPGTSGGGTFRANNFTAPVTTEHYNTESSFLTSGYQPAAGATGDKSSTWNDGLNHSGRTLLLALAPSATEDRWGSGTGFSGNASLGTAEGYAPITLSVVATGTRTSVANTDLAYISSVFGAPGRTLLVAAHSIDGVPDGQVVGHPGRLDWCDVDGNPVATPDGAGPWILVSNATWSTNYVGWAGSWVWVSWINEGATLSGARVAYRSRVPALLAGQIVIYAADQASIRPGATAIRESGTDTVPIPMNVDLTVAARSRAIAAVMTGNGNLNLTPVSGTTIDAHFWTGIGSTTDAVSTGVIEAGGTITVGVTDVNGWAAVAALEVRAKSADDRGGNQPAFSAVATLGAATGTSGAGEESRTGSGTEFAGTGTLGAAPGSKNATGTAAELTGVSTVGPAVGSRSTTGTGSTLSGAGTFGQSTATRQSNGTGQTLAALAALSASTATRQSNGTGLVLSGTANLGPATGFREGGADTRTGTGTAFTASSQLGVATATPGRFGSTAPFAGVGVLGEAPGSPNRDGALSSFQASASLLEGVGFPTRFVTANPLVAVGVLGVVSGLRLPPDEVPVVEPEEIVLLRAMDTAKKLIQKFGAAIELVKFVDVPPPDVQKPWRVESATALVQTCRGVFLPAKRQYMGKQTDAAKDSNGVPSMERRVLIAAQGLTDGPSLKGEIRAGSSHWAIVSIQTIGPDGNAIIYILQVRQ